MDFATGLPISIGKGISYDSIPVTIDQLKKMLRDEPVQITIDAPGLAEVSTNLVI